MAGNVFYNGKEAWGRPVRVELREVSPGDGYLEVYDEPSADGAASAASGGGGALQVKWAVGQISRLKIREEEGEFCLTSGGQARLILRDKVLQEKLLEGKKISTPLPVDAKIAIYCVGAVLALGLLYWYGVGLLAKSVLSFIPQTYDTQMGESAFKEITKGKKICKSKQGITALNKLKATSFDSNLSNIKVIVLKDKTENAAALPGGYIIIFSGLLDDMHDPAMLEAILAHEIGHVVYRHGMERLLTTAALAAFTALLTGDVSLMTVFIVNISSNRYTQDMETAADAYALSVMKEKGIDPKPLTDWFKKIGKKKNGKNILSYFQTHPHPIDRVDFFNKDKWQIKQRITPQDWVQLKNICS